MSQKVHILYIKHEWTFCAKYTDLNKERGVGVITLKIVPTQTAIRYRLPVLPV